MGSGGEVANRGFIFQSIIAMIECLERNDWDEIKMEPITHNDKVDIMLYENSRAVSAIQVKSSINPFRVNDVKEWLEKLKKDASGAKEICLYLVGDSFKPLCLEFINNNPAVKSISFQNLQNICTEKLIAYIKRTGIEGDARWDDLKLVDNQLFAKIHKNSISKEPISRASFEAAFRKAMPVHMIPLCLTAIPAINQTVGLVGRDGIKRDIRNYLNNNSCTVLVSGIGGIGKTAVMQHICNDLKNEGHYVAWIECSDSLREDILTLRNALGIPETDSVEEAYEKVINELRSRLSGKLYLFMDNLYRVLSEDEQRTLNGLGIHIMATSRIEHACFANLFLDVLDKPAAIDMFYRYYGQDQERRYEKTAWCIIESVHCHTLLVELLAKAAWEEGGTLDSFYEILQEKGFFDASAEITYIGNDYKEQTIEESLIKLYEISGLSEIQQHIMRLFTIFTPEREVYYKVRDWGGLDRQEIRKLVLLGWLEKGGLENGYKIHQVVRDSLVKQMKRKHVEVDLYDYGELMEKIIRTDVYLSDTLTYEFIRERIGFIEDILAFLGKKSKAYVESLINGASLSEEDEDWIGDYGLLMNNIAGVFFVRGDYEKALELFKNELTISVYINGEDHLLTASSYNNVAMVYEIKGNYSKALEYYEKAMSVEEKMMVCDEKEAVATYNGMADLFVEQGEFDKAIEWHQKAYSLINEETNEANMDTALTYNSMARLNALKGNHGQALEYFKRASGIYQEKLGKNHPYTAITYHNMAEVYSAMGEYGNAIENYAKALEINERVLGEDHPDTAKTYYGLAAVFNAQGANDKALELSLRALVISKKKYGNDHPFIAEMYDNIAVMYGDQGNYSKAMEYFENALVIKTKTLGENHPSLAKVYNNMAVMYARQGDYKKALMVCQKVLKLCDRKMRIEASEMVITYNNLAMLYENMQNYEKVMEYYGKALEIIEQVPYNRYSLAAQIYSNFAGMYYKRSEYEMALKYYKKALTVFQSIFGKNHYDTIRIQNIIEGLKEIMDK